MSLLKFSQTPPRPPAAPTGPWVLPTVARLMITCPTWPVVLWANHGQTRVEFATPAELRAATLPSEGDNYYQEG